MDHGQTYVCDWKKIPAGWRVWVVQKPELAIEGSDFADCKFDLAVLIIGSIGDTEPVIEYRRGLPASLLPARFARPSYWSLGKNAGASLADPEAPWFAGGRCPVCRGGIGPRSTAPLRLSRCDRADGMCIARQSGFVVYSQRLLEAIGLLDSAQFELRPVQIDRSCMAVLEVVARDPRVVLTEIAVKDFEGRQEAVCCRGCGFRGVTSQSRDNRLMWFVAARDVAEVPGGIFLLGDSLCVPGRTWRRVREAIAVKGVAAQQVGVAADGDIDHDVSLRYLV